MQVNAEILTMIGMASAVAWLIVELKTSSIEKEIPSIKKRLAEIEEKRSERDKQLFQLIGEFREDFHAHTLSLEKRFSGVVTVEECRRQQHECLTTKTHIIPKEKGQ